MFYEIGRRIYYTWNDDQAIWEMKLLKDDPLMLVSGVGALEGESADFGFQRYINDFREWDIQVVRPFVACSAACRRTRSAGMSRKA